MTDIVRTIREALEFHREHAGDPSVSWHDETVTQWLSQAADEIERLEADIAKYKDQLGHYSNLGIPPIPDLRFSVRLDEEETP